MSEAKDNSLRVTLVNPTQTFKHRRENISAVTS